MTQKFPFRHRSFLALSTLLLAPVLSSRAFAAGAPVKGGTLICLGQQAHTVLYPPAGGF